MSHEELLALLTRARAVLGHYLFEAEDEPIRDDVAEICMAIDDALPEEERAARRKELEDEYREDVDLYKLASNLIVDDVVEPDRLREVLIARFRAYSTRVATRVDRKHGVFPV